MNDEQIGAIVREAIDRATENMGWSRAQLGRRIGVSIATIHRWHSNTADRYHLGKLAQIFDYAGLSLDEQFGVRNNARTDSTQIDDPKTLHEELKAIKQSLLEIQQQLAVLQPVAELVQLVAAAAADLVRGKAQAEGWSTASGTESTGLRSARRVLTGVRNTSNKFKQPAPSEGTSTAEHDEHSA
jgi:transcriptional regulator with XRE-family HTH domain